MRKIWTSFRLGRRASSWMQYSFECSWYRKISQYTLVHCWRISPIATDSAEDRHRTQSTRYRLSVKFPFRCVWNSAKCLAIVTLFIPIETTSRLPKGSAELWWLRMIAQLRKQGQNPWSISHRFDSNSFKLYYTYVELLMSSFWMRAMASHSMTKPVCAFLRLITAENGLENRTVSRCTSMTSIASQHMPHFPALHPLFWRCVSLRMSEQNRHTRLTNLRFHL